MPFEFTTELAYSCNIASIFFNFMQNIAVLISFLLLFLIFTRSFKRLFYLTVRPRIIQCTEEKCSYFASITHHFHLSLNLFTSLFSLATLSKNYRKNLKKSNTFLNSLLMLKFILIFFHSLIYSVENSYVILNKNIFCWLQL